ncbi:hypothetical protein [Salinicola tamaricis]|uniref:hypothetical protein n=1 Tax=Salinicola tamaricis TaxID=1771309 RepID=UPI001F5D148C|nr:hypothetical protein [Salinicola tamaricis]
MTTFERHSVTPWLLLAPQLAVVAIFFFWPAAESLRQAFYVQDAFGLGERFVGLANFQHVLASPGYWHAFGVTALFSLLVAAGAMGWRCCWRCSPTACSMAPGSIACC